MTDQNLGTRADELVQSSGRLALAIGRLNRRMLRATETLGHSGLSALSSIVKFGPLRLNELAQREGVAPATITRIAVDLVDRGFITRTKDRHDRRATTVEATTAGIDYIIEARSARADVIASLVSTLDEADLNRLAEALPVLEALVIEASHGERS